VAIISNAVTIADAGALSLDLGGMVHIKTLTASNSANLTFVHGTSDVVLDGTYPIYKFVFVNMHCAENDGYFLVNFRDGGTAYDAPKQTTFFRAQHGADDSSELAYDNGGDLANGTGVQRLSNPTGSENDESLSGSMVLYSPASTVFVKHFISEVSDHDMSDYNQHCFVAGYSNHTAALDGVQFTFNAGNIQSGKIKLYGIKDS